MIPRFQIADNGIERLAEASRNRQTLKTRAVGRLHHHGNRFEKMGELRRQRGQPSPTTQVIEIFGQQIRMGAADYRQQAADDLLGAIALLGEFDCTES